MDNNKFEARTAHDQRYGIRSECMRKLVFIQLEILLNFIRIISNRIMRAI